MTGDQGVVFPRSNEPSLILDDEMAADIAAGRFHVYSAAHVDEALELFTGIEAGAPDADGNYPAGSVYARVAERLAAFDNALDERDR